MLAHLHTHEFGGQDLPAAVGGRTGQRPVAADASTPALKVIVAEDSELQRLFLCSLINGLGFQAIEASDGCEALDLIQTSGAQILISDLKMPHIDGISLTREVRRLGLPHYVHIIMVTGADEVALRDDALRAGVDDFITKGSSTAILKARLRTATRLIAHADALAERTRVLTETNARIQDDLRAAADAQRQLLPTLRDDILGVRVASAFVPSAIVSGDMFGCFELEGGKLGFYTVDVSGHGIHASLLSVAIGHLVTKDFFQSQAFDDAGQPDPARLARVLNQRFSASDNDDYLTMFCGVLEAATGQLSFCQAGAPSPICISETGEEHQIGDGGFPVGLIPNASYVTNTHTLAPGSALVLCSDAAGEAENAAHVPFGQARLRDVARSAAMQDFRTLPQAIVSALGDWRGGNPLDDDLTVVVFKRTSNND